MQRIHIARSVLGFLAALAIEIAAPARPSPPVARAAAALSRAPGAVTTRLATASSLSRRWP